MVLSGRAASSLLGGRACYAAATIKLYMKDGSYQLVREYKVENDRVSFSASTAANGRKFPLSLVDLEKTKAEIKSARGNRCARRRPPTQPKKRPNGMPAKRWNRFPRRKASI